jgi:hypothetical protein
MERKIAGWSSKTTSMARTTAMARTIPDPVTILHKDPLLRRFIYCETGGEFIGSINVMYYGMGKQLPIMLG